LQDYGLDPCNLEQSRGLLKAKTKQQAGKIVVVPLLCRGWLMEMVGIVMWAVGV